MRLVRLKRWDCGVMNAVLRARCGAKSMQPARWRRVAIRHRYRSRRAQWRRIVPWVSAGCDVSTSQRRSMEAFAAAIAGSMLDMSGIPSHVRYGRGSIWSERPRTRPALKRTFRRACRAIESFTNASASPMRQPPSSGASRKAPRKEQCGSGKRTTASSSSCACASTPALPTAIDASSRLYNDCCDSRHIEPARNAKSEAIPGSLLPA